MNRASDQNVHSHDQKFPMLWTLGFLLFGGFFLATTVSYLVSRHSIRDTILKDELPLSSDNIYSEIQRDLFEPILISSLMANDTFVKDWVMRGEQDDESIIRYLAQIQKKYKTITSFLVSDKSRKYYHSGRVLKSVQENDPVDQWFFRVRTMNEDYEINVDPDKANRDTMTIFINYRMLGPDGEFLAATGVGLTVNAVKSLMQDYRLRYNRDVYFFDRDGALVLHSLNDTKEAGVKIPKNLPRDKLLEILSRFESGEQNITLSGESWSGSMANYRYIPELDWILVVEQNSDGTSSILTRSIGFNLIICLLTAGILLSVIHSTVLGYQKRLESRNNRLQERNQHIEEQAKALTEANKKLDAMHREKDELIGIVVHDLKNPLSSILGFSEMLQQNPAIVGEDRESLDYIRQSGGAMLEKVEDLLKISEIESSRDIELEEVDAVEVVRLAANEHAFYARTKRTTIDLQLPETRIPILAKETWIITALGNLISNAIKFSLPGKVVNISLLEIGDKIEICVRDEGPGIPADELKHLFGKFERLSSRPTGGESSTGLGLFIVEKMVSRMGGSVRCESKLGEGSAFYISLPAQQHLQKPSCSS